MWECSTTMRRTLAIVLLMAMLWYCGSSSPMTECDEKNLFVADEGSVCVFYQCVNRLTYKFACAKGTRVPSYYTRGDSNPCTLRAKSSISCARQNVNDRVPLIANVTNLCAIYQPCASKTGCTCIDQVNGYYCSCPAATTVGPTPKNEPGPQCDINVCKNGGTCYSLYKSSFCNCIPPWTGKYCEVNECSSMACNHGVCTYDKFSVYCQCEACFTGSFCDVPLQTASCAGCNECVGGDNCTEVRTDLCKCSPCWNVADTCVDGIYKVHDRSCIRGPSTASDSFVFMFGNNLSGEPVLLEVHVSPATDDGILRYVRIDAPLGSGNCTYDDYFVIIPFGWHRFYVDSCFKHVSTGVNNFGIRVREINGSLINVYCINKALYSIDGWLALPDKIAGKYFVVISYSPTAASQFAFVAISNGTVVNMYLSADSEQLSCSGSKCRFIQVNLAAYQTFQLSSAINDLSGTVIESNKPIHVYSGEARAWVSPSPASPYYIADVPIYGRSRDNLILECTSIETWGYTYAIVPLPRNIIGYNYTEEVARVAGSVPTSCILYATLSPPSNYSSFPVNLNASNSYVAQFYMDAEYNYFLACDHPVMLVEITESAIQTISLYNDPSFILGISYSSYANLYFFYPPQYASITLDEYKFMFVRLVALNPDYKQIVINNKLLFPTPPTVNSVLKPWTQIYAPPNGFPSSEYPKNDLYGAIFSIEHIRPSSIIHPNPNVCFMCIVEVFDDRVSFGIAVGADIQARRNDSPTSFSSVLAAPHGTPDLILP